MKAKELMIGDWVYDKMLKGYGKIEVLTPFTIQCNIHTDTHNMDFFEAIPLSPEILEKNGLNLGRNSIAEDTFMHIDFMEIFINNFTPNKLVRVLINHKECFCYEGLHLYLKFQYVHELQHALRLCGLNELADNFKVV